MPSNKTVTLEEVQAAEFFHLYQEALEQSMWPGLEGNKAIPLDYMSIGMAREVLLQIASGAVEGLELNPNLKLRWITTLERITRHRIKRNDHEQSGMGSAEFLDPHTARAGSASAKHVEFNPQER
ncbi:hypothetical protein TW86_03690 [Halomonas sp. S2151]|uniref:hypothetical protein n=1 Tax=Halomonas sp. S2151 TaxID=579478 RepID=UPI0005FA8EB1|nr:hypothetical protein [Halomonas sp. S2151]KJZ17369.1 hypothetical protein TW86_03690 [Halomonas sp. S2151]